MARESIVHRVVVLLSTAYFPPVSWFAAAAKDFRAVPGIAGPALLPSVVWLESCENFVKQSWRSRFNILSAGGVESLHVPVVHVKGRGVNIPITEIAIDWSVPWAIRTERAIESAYGSSPFFEYYRDEIFGVLDSMPHTLWELNLRLIRLLFDKIGIAVDLRFTTEWLSPAPAEYGEDLREAIHPKRPDGILRDLGLEKPYFQVFSQKYGFQSDLSIIDLLFNEGPSSIEYLKVL